MSTDLKKALVMDFVQNSWPCVEAIVKDFTKFREAPTKKRLFHFRNERGDEKTLDNSHFFIRASVEYSTPQVTAEELQGIMAARLLEACGTYFSNYGIHRPDEKDVDQICEMLSKPSQDVIVSFLLNTDDVEADRYSANPLRESIVSSGQSAFPVASVKTKDLKVDQAFVGKYDGVLITRAEADLITRQLEKVNNSYVDMVDGVKYEQLRDLSRRFGVDLCIDSMRMPLEVLKRESSDDLLHHIISAVHSDFGSVERAYSCMGRSIRSRTTLLTIPHSRKGFGSKRAAKGKIYFDGEKLKEVQMTYRTTPLYDNEVDPKDISVAVADDSFIIDGDQLIHYSFRETPSSPQFALYSLASPENCAVWHGIGVFGAPSLLKSIVTVRLSCARGSMVKDLEDKYGVSPHVPLNFNLVPKHMWAHPVHHNIDASVGCVQNLGDLAAKGMHVEQLSNL